MIQLQRIIDLISSLNSEGTVASIHSALAELSEILQIDRCVLRSRVGNTNTFKVISEWCAEGLIPIDVLEPEMDSQASINLVEQFLLHGEVKINDIYASAEFSLEEKQRAKDWQCRAVLFIPLRYQNAINGMIVAIQGLESRVWSIDDKYCTQLIGETALAVWLHNQSLQALSDSRQQYQWAMDASNDAIWDWNLETNTVEFSQRFYHMLGYDPDITVIDAELYQKHIHPDDFVLINRVMGIPREFKAKSSFIEFRVFTVAGEILWLRSNSQVVQVDSNGFCVRMVGVYSDITTFKKTLQQLELARQNADRANLSKSEFLARMSHEVRTPLNAIMGMLHLMKETPLTENQFAKLQIMQDASTQLLTVLNDVLDFSKIESGKLDLECIPFSIDELVQQVLALMAVKAEEKGLQLLLNFSLDTPESLIGDPNRLSQILTNLLANAIKFTSHGEVVLNVVVKQKNNHRVNLEFSVLDSGIGIKDEEMSLLFNSFAQAKKSISREYGGSGLGLSICKSLAELMGGNILAESRYGKGSAFRFTVQLQLPEISKCIFADKESCKTKRILLLSSNRMVVDSYHSLFFGLQMPMDSFNSTDIDENAINQLNVNKYDILLLDTCASKESLEFFHDSLNLIMQKNSLLPVIICAAFLSDDIKLLMDKCKNVRFMSRPLTPMKMAKYFSMDNDVSSEANLNVKLSEQDRLRLSCMKVMLVEDNSVNRMIAVGMLSKFGVAVQEMELGSVAVDWINANGFKGIDCILMDIEMPGMDGFNATAMIRERVDGHHIPIIAMTANTLNTDIKKCYQAGMNGHISKPVDPDYLISCLLDYAPVMQ